MACVEAPCLAVLKAETDRLYPRRNRASDGLCPSAEHRRQNPNSDHNDGNARDVTHDPGPGPDMHGLVALIVQRRDPRVKYLIFDGQIWRSYDKHRSESEAARTGLPRYTPAWSPEPYHGRNQHRTHLHVSVYDAMRNDRRSWWQGAPEPRPLITSSVEVDAMQLKTVPVPLKFDPQGNAWVYLDGRHPTSHGVKVPLDRLVALIPHGPHVADENTGEVDQGYLPIAGVGVQDRGGFPYITLTRGFGGGGTALFVKYLADE